MINRDNLIVMLRDYRHNCANCRKLRMEIRAIETEINKTTFTRAVTGITGARFTRYYDPITNEECRAVMPRGTNNPEAASIQAEDGLRAVIDNKRAELFIAMRQHDRMEIMLDALYIKERFVIDKHLIGRLTYRETSALYRREFGVEIGEEALKKIQDQALVKMAEIYPDR